MTVNGVKYGTQGNIVIEETEITGSEAAQQSTSVDRMLKEFALEMGHIFSY